MAHLGALGIFEQRLESSEYLVAIQLVGGARIVVGDRHISSDAGGGRKRHADDLRLHVVQARRFSVEREELGGRNASSQRSKVSQSVMVS